MEGAPSRDVPPHWRSHCGLMDWSFGVRKSGLYLVALLKSGTRLEEKKAASASSFCVTENSQ